MWSKKIPALDRLSSHVKNVDLYMDASVFVTFHVFCIATSLLSVGYFIYIIALAAVEYWERSFNSYQFLSIDIYTGFLLTKTINKIYEK